jgi:hypothetical protein
MLKTTRFDAADFLDTEKKQAAYITTVPGRSPVFRRRRHSRSASRRSAPRHPRVSDEFAVPLYRVHHRELHLPGDEIAWLEGVGLKPLEVAERLWRRTRFGAAGMSEACAW